MKKLLLALALLTTGAAHAQITLEHRYNGSPTSNNFTTTKFSNGELKYVTVSAGAAPAVTVYNENHSVLKQMALPVVANSYFQGIYFLSDKLFNQDSNIEYMCAYGVTVGTQTLYRLLVVNEAGTQLLVADTATYYNAARVISGNTGLKLVIPTGRVDATGNGSGSYTKVYSLGGTFNPLPVKADVSTTGAALPYPNPATSQVALPYDVKTGQTGALVILDEVGRVVRSFQIGPAYKELILSTNDLKAGAYLYRVSTADGTTPAKRFVIE